MKKPPKDYIPQVIYYKMREVLGKEYELAQNGMRVDLSLSLDELDYIYKCITNEEPFDD